MLSISVGNPYSLPLDPHDFKVNTLSTPHRTSRDQQILDTLVAYTNCLSLRSYSGLEISTEFRRIETPVLGRDRYGGLHGGYRFSFTKIRFCLL